MKTLFCHRKVPVYCIGLNKATCRVNCNFMKQTCENFIASRGFINLKLNDQRNMLYTDCNKHNISFCEQTPCFNLSKITNNYIRPWCAHTFHKIYELFGPWCCAEFHFALCVCLCWLSVCGITLYCMIRIYLYWYINVCVWMCMWGLGVKEKASQSSWCWTLLYDTHVQTCGNGWKVGGGCALNGNSQTTAWDRGALACFGLPAYYIYTSAILTHTNTHTAGWMKSKDPLNPSHHSRYRPRLVFEFRSFMWFCNLSLQCVLVKIVHMQTYLWTHNIIYVLWVFFYFDCIQ